MAYATTKWDAIGTYETGRGTIVEQQRTLFDGIAANDNGEWMDTLGWDSFNCSAVITSTQTVNLMGSNAAAKPADSSHGSAITTALTATGYFSIARHQIPRWLKVYTSSTSGGSSVVTAKVHRFAGDRLP